MEAIILSGFGGPEVLVPAEVPEPEGAPTDVVVRVLAAGINPIDLKTRQGGGLAGLFGAGPKILGWDVAGIVESVGRGVTRFSPGDMVFGMPWFPRPAGAYAQLAAAPSRHFARLPAALSAIDAAAVPLAALTAWQALVSTAALAAGQRVLIHGAAGGVGYLAVQIAKARGAEVVATARAGDTDFLEALGADTIIDYTTTRFEDSVSGLDVVLDLVGQDGYPERSLRVLARGGTLVVVPSAAPRPAPEAAADHGVRVTGIMVEPDRADLESIAALIEAGRLRVRSPRSFPLREAAGAHRALERREVRGKAVLVP